MNGTSTTFFGLEFNNNGSYFQIRLDKSFYTRIGRLTRDFLLVACTLTTMSVLTVAIIVVVTTTVAEADQQTERQAITGTTTDLPALPGLGHDMAASDPLYTFNDGHQFRHGPYPELAFNH